MAIFYPEELWLEIFCTHHDLYFVQIDIKIDGVAR